MDNGSTFANAQLSLICGALGIVKIHTPVRDGASKAKVERSFRTIKDTWLHGFDPAGVSSLGELNRLLTDEVRKRNTTLNRSIDMTPMERYQQGIHHVRPLQSREWLDECFMNRITRKVNLDATVSMDKKSYDVPMQFIRSTVEIRFLPNRMEDAYIFFEGTHYPIRLTNRVENGQMLSRLDYLKNTRGIGLFTAPPGMGKTFALRCFAKTLNPNLFQLSYVCLSTVSVSDFYHQFSSELGLDYSSKKTVVFKNIQERLFHLFKEKRKTFILAIDESQYLSTGNFRDIKMLTNVHFDSLDCFALILIGQPYLASILEKPVHESLRQRIIVHYNYEGLASEKAKDYIMLLR